MVVPDGWGLTSPIGFPPRKKKANTMNNINFVTHHANGTTSESTPSINRKTSMRTSVRGTITIPPQLDAHGNAKLTLRTNGGVTFVGAINATAYNNIIESFGSHALVEGQSLLVLGNELTGPDAQDRRHLNILGVRLLTPENVTVH